jgi:Ca2+-binding RTX toxin-like protein
MTNTIDFKKLGKHGLNDGGVTSVVFMNNGNDQLLVEANDTVVGGSGIDSVGVHSGNCLIYGGDGPMAIYMNQPLVRSTVPASGSAEVIGGGGPLAFFGGPESSTVFGGQSTTSIAGGTGAVNILVGGTGDSTVTGNGTFDFIIAGTGNATLTANGMNSTVFGGNGSDVITASSVSGASTIVGGAGADTINLAGNSTAFSGSGADTYDIGGGGPSHPVVIVNFKGGVDQLNQDIGGTLTPIAPSFSEGLFQTTLQDGTHLAVYAAS